jgi:hypothetical protein
MLPSSETVSGWQVEQESGVGDAAGCGGGGGRPWQLPQAAWPACVQSGAPAALPPGKAPWQ